MGENVPNKATITDNPLARELMESRAKMRDRLMIEGQKSYYKVSTISSHSGFLKKRFQIAVIKREYPFLFRIAATDGL